MMGIAFSIALYNINDNTDGIYENIEKLSRTP
jgi:hypothetical protein